MHSVPMYRKRRHRMPSFSFRSRPVADEILERRIVRITRGWKFAALTRFFPIYRTGLSFAASDPRILFSTEEPA